MDKTDALKFWEMEFGDKEYSHDFSGKKIKRDDYGIENQVGWVVAYVKPLELGGPKSDSNTIIMHHRTYEEKGLNYPTFQIIDKKYSINYDKKFDFYYIERDIDYDDDF